MAEPKKTALELNDSDWGKVAVALDHELGRARKDADEPHLPNVCRLKLAIEVGRLARIRDDIRNQRRAIRYGQVTDQSVSKL